MPDPAAPAGDDPILGAYDAAGDEGEPEEAPGLPIGPDEVSAFLVGMGDLLAQLRGPHWRIEPSETGIIAPPLARQLAKPDTAAAAWLAQHSDALLIAIGATAIVLPRAIIEYRVLRNRRERYEGHEDGNTRAARGAPAPGPRPRVPDDGEPAAGRAGAARSEDDAATLRALTSY